jgi:Rod binding domain-containing protein
MDILPTNVSSTLAPDLVGQLHMAGDSKQAQTKIVAEQFESVLLKQFLDKSVGSMMGDGPGSQEYGYMLTDALSQSLAKGGGLGMASILERQLSQPGSAPVIPLHAKNLR